MQEVRWITSSYCSHANCVEVGVSNGVVLVRDTKDDLRQVVLEITASAWRDFLEDLKNSALVVS